MLRIAGASVVMKADGIAARTVPDISDFYPLAIAHEKTIAVFVFRRRSSRS